MTKILVVDDDLALADVIAFTLRRAGLDLSPRDQSRQVFTVLQPVHSLFEKQP